MASPKMPPASTEFHFDEDVLLQFLRYDSRRDERLTQHRNWDHDGVLSRGRLLEVDAILCEYQVRERIPKGTSEAIRLSERRRP